MGLKRISLTLYDTELEALDKIVEEEKGKSYNPSKVNRSSVIRVWLTNHLAKAHADRDL